MKKIAIGDEQEYCRRLSDYLMRHLPPYMRVYSFSSPKHLIDYKDRADIYLLGEEFYEILCEMDSSFHKENILLLGKEKGENSFCRMDKPEKLVRYLEDRFSSIQKEQKNIGQEHHITAIYAPFSDISLKDWVWPMMQTGDLYLGFEDVGDTIGVQAGISQDGKEEPGMTELCYYIRLHEEEILTELKGMIRSKEGRFYLDSPAWYFDMLGLEEEDYHWFFQQMKEKSDFMDLYVGLGHASIPSLEYFKQFDRLILLEKVQREKTHRFCDRLATVLAEEEYMGRDRIERRYLS